jgi:hypothetical protein
MQVVLYPANQTGAINCIPTSLSIGTIQKLQGCNFWIAKLRRPSYRTLRIKSNMIYLCRCLDESCTSSGQGWRMCSNNSYTSLERC